MLNRRYHIDLDNFLAQAEWNYQNLMTLIRREGKGRRSFSWAIGRQGMLDLDVLESHPYTTMIAIRIKPSQSQPWRLPVYLWVRVYHDAQVAEVVGFQEHRSLKAKYQYPNPDMLLPNEKQQCNAFLSECLLSCLRDCPVRPISQIQSKK